MLKTLGWRRANMAGTWLIGILAAIFMLYEVSGEVGMNGRR